MPFKSIPDLPKSVRNVLPSHAQEIYLEAFNSAWEQYDQPQERLEDRSREETAHRVAWSAVKQKYEKYLPTGKWKRKN
jgi:cation transport regulator